MLKRIFAEFGAAGLADGSMFNNLRKELVNHGLVTGEAPLIEQIAIGCSNPALLIEGLKLLGLNQWHRDSVVAVGSVFGRNNCQNLADLNFNYQLGFELELLHYEQGRNWHEDRNEWCYAESPFLSHIGIHVNPMQLEEYKAKFKAAGVQIAQEVNTVSHTNPAIAGKRLYKYVVFDTKELFGFDFKLILRIDTPQEG